MASVPERCRGRFSLAYKLMKVILNQYFPWIGCLEMIKPRSKKQEVEKYKKYSGMLTKHRCYKNSEIYFYI
jgi:hypothetical protein